MLHFLKFETSEMISLMNLYAVNYLLSLWLVCYKRVFNFVRGHFD